GSAGSLPICTRDGRRLLSIGAWRLSTGVRAPSSCPRSNALQLASPSPRQAAPPAFPKTSRCGSLAFCTRRFTSRYVSGDDCAAALVVLDRAADRVCGPDLHRFDPRGLFGVLVRALAADRSSGRVLKGLSVCGLPRGTARRHVARDLFVWP